MSHILKQAFDIDSFRSIGHALIDQLAEQLAANQTASIKVMPPTTPDEQLEYWRSYEVKSAEQFFRDISNQSIQLHHPHYIGHQVATPAPEAALAGLVSDFLNNGMGVFEMGAAATAIEKIVIEEFCRKVDYTADSDGFLTSGGTLANLTALLAAHNHCRSQFPDKKKYILVSEQAHYCIDRAAATMGLEPSQVIKIKTNEQYQMSIPLLAAHIDQYNSGDNVVMAVVASACTTATGTYDDINAIAQLTQLHNIWLHVDGAHGGAVAWSPKYKHLLAGAQLSNSMIIDAHKMMLVPALATAVLFREGGSSYRTFQQAATYLFEKQEDEWYNLAKRTYETTKYMMGIKIFLLLRKYGDQIIDDFVTSQYDKTQLFADYLVQHPNFEIAHQPMANILCFRYICPDLDQSSLNELNRLIRQEILLEGSFYIVQTMLDNTQYLRTTLMNPNTTLKELNSLVDHIEAKALDILNSNMAV